VYAAVSKGPAQKFARGIAHVLSAPFQVPKEMIETTAEAELAWLAPWEGATAGLGKGLFHFGRQLVSGFADLFTFASPSGRDWAPIFEPNSLFPEV